METERLFLREWKDDDAPELYRYASDPRVGPICGWPPHISVENSREIIQNVLAVPETYAIVLKETRLPIGCISLYFGDKTDLTDEMDECELGYWLGVPYWGQGLITEAGREILRHAFEDLVMERVWAGYYDGNLRSKRVQEKLGMTWHHTTQNVPVPRMNEIRVGHVNFINRKKWETEHRNAEK